MTDTLWTLMGGDLFVMGLFITALAVVVTVITWPFHAFMRWRRENKR